MVLAGMRELESGEPMSHMCQCAGGLFLSILGSYRCCMILPSTGAALVGSAWLFHSKGPGLWC